VYVGRHYSLREITRWTRREAIVFVLLGCVPPVLSLLGVNVAIVPWAPLAVLGTAVAFVTGFKSNAAYGRLWEARQIWGAIVNASRAWAVMVRDFVRVEPGSELYRRVALRHVAWLTALRYQLREPRAWETQELRHNREYQAQKFALPERAVALHDELAKFLPPAELSHVLEKKNRASAVLALQSAELRRCHEEGCLTELGHIELVRMVATLIEQQGKCERIKNFPYPRQFATLNLFFVWLFILLLPFGVATELKRLGTGLLWLTIPLTTFVAWVFHTMDKIGEASENPFESGPNDTPMTAMSRAIEIDLRDLMNESDLPEPHGPSNDILM
jgi:putative membrane protein